MLGIKQPQEVWLLFFWVRLPVAVIRAADGLTAQFAAGQAFVLAQVVIEVLAFDATGFDAVTRSTGRFPSFLAGLDRLGEAGISRSARLVVDADRAARVPHALGEIRARRLGLDAVVVLEGAPYASIEQAVLAAGFTAGVLRRPPS